MGPQDCPKYSWDLAPDLGPGFVKGDFSFIQAQRG